MRFSTEQFVGWATQQQHGQLSAWLKFFQSQVEHLKHVELQYVNDPKTRNAIRFRRIETQRKVGLLAGLLKADIKAIEPPVVEQDSFAQLEITTK